VNLLRTPDDCFAALPGFDFEPHYLTVRAGDPAPFPGDDHEIRVHYLDEGPAGAAETVLLLHGEPSWCYLYRKMIPVLTAAGHRAVAPDLVGFGRSDKPSDRADYTYARHVEWMREACFDRLDLRGVTLVCQDWGGLIGLRLVAEHPERFARVVTANTGLPTGDLPMGEAFEAWRRFSQEVAEMPIGAIISGGTVTSLPPDVVAAYDAPFPEERYKEGARAFPVLVPAVPDDPASEDNRRAWDSLRTFDRPFLCAFSDGDPITRGADALFRSAVPGTTGQPHTTINGAGHFLQEDKGEQLAAVVNAFIAATGAG
jgi:haloalkane dehalogenase